MYFKILHTEILLYEIFLLVSLKKINHAFSVEKKKCPGRHHTSRKSSVKVIVTRCVLQGKLSPETAFVQLISQVF